MQWKRFYIGWRIGCSAGASNGWPKPWEEGVATNAETIVTAIVGAVFGGAGIVGLVFAYVRHFIDKRLADRDKEDAKRRETRLRRLTIEDEWYHAAGRLFFFINKAVETGQHNGDLKRAFEQFQDAEAKKKALDREILAESEVDL